ncbi:MAG TPA: ATP-binding cassette domain-containing protein [Methylomirabilota bacterium]|nr:ATP-binding cassette domain-containing protein [Methylomirabilota bacterium]
MIEVENLSKVYVDVPVVDGLSFFVPEGQVLGFLGPNGAGKTTAMRMITAFLPPTSGRVVVAGVDLDDDPVALRRAIGYLPENAPLYPELRVDEYLRFRADVEGVPRVERAARLDEAVDRCMLGEVRRQVIGTLSKGYRQRVGLAGALIHSPPVLILDEPTVGLDPNQIIKVRELITELGRDHTVVLSTHILPEVEQVCERVFIIDRGRIVADGTPDALRSKLLGNPGLQVELGGAGDAAAEALGRLEGAVAVAPRGPGRFVVEHEPGADLREAVYRLAVERGWVLLGLTPEQTTLEDVFVRLTTAEGAPAPAAAPEV